MSDFDVTPVVWRVTAVPEDSHPDFSYDLDDQYRLDDGEWQLLSSDGWHKSQWSGLGEMVGAGYVLEAEPDPDTVPAVPTGWRRGDPEPPQGINILRDPVSEGEAFLCRLENGAWEWFSDPDDRTGVRVSQSWDQAMQEADGPVYPVPAVSEQEEA